MIKSDQKYWFALYTKSRHEFKSKEQLSAISIQNYLPTVTRIKQWSDRKRKIEEPVLKGYVFICADEGERLNALELSSITRCVCDLGRPAIIPDWQIDNLKRMLRQDAEFIVNEGLVSGTKVEIKAGPFTGVIGVIQSSGDSKTIAVSIELLNRTIVAHLPKDIVDKIE